MENKYLSLKPKILFGSIEKHREVSLNGNVYNFSVDYNSIDKSDILNRHKYLMTK